MFSVSRGYHISCVSNPISYVCCRGTYLLGLFFSYPNLALSLVVLCPYRFLRLRLSVLPLFVVP